MIFIHNKTAQLHLRNVQRLQIMIGSNHAKKCMLDTCDKCTLNFYSMMLSLLQVYSYLARASYTENQIRLYDSAVFLSHTDMGSVQQTRGNLVRLGALGNIIHH